MTLTGPDHVDRIALRRVLDGGMAITISISAGACCAP